MNLSEIKDIDTMYQEIKNLYQSDKKELVRLCTSGGTSLNIDIRAIPKDDRGNIGRWFKIDNEIYVMDGMWLAKPKNDEIALFVIKRYDQLILK